MKLKIREILNEYGVKYEEIPGDTGKIKVLCPYHADSNPSGIISTDSNRFHCFGCNVNDNIYGFLRRKLGKDVYFSVNKKFSGIVDSTLVPEIVEEGYAALKRDKNSPYLKALYDRKITDHDIDDHRIGLIKDRISIPIKNAAEFYVNIRLYKPGDKNKFLNYPKFGNPPRLFPINQLQYDQIVLCGGELKALALLRELNPEGYGAISPTTGENKLPFTLASEFANKIVYVCLDIDEVGRKATQLWANALRAAGASKVYIIELPLSLINYPKGDINDYLALGEKFLPLIKESKEWEFKPTRELYLEIEDPIDITLTNAVHADLTTKRIKLKAVVSTMDIAPYHVPSEIEVICDRSEKFCDICYVSGLPPDKQIVRISAENPALLKIINDTSKIHSEASKEAIGIPKRCKKCDFKVLSFYNMEEAKLSEPFSLQSKDTKRSMQSAFCVGKALELNTNYEMTGRVFPHPKTQQATLLISSYKPTEDALSNYVCNDLDALRIFQPKEWTKEGLEEKLIDLYNDLEANVTRIFERKDLHLAVDLTYHSPLFLPIEGEAEKGWVETLIVGDSEQGKSWVSQRLMAYYNLGEKIDCSNVTKAGLIGGSENFGKRWFVTWGKIPLNDRGLVLLEELKELKPEIFAKCLEMRSSGVAQIDSIVKKTAYARTRLIANSNARSSRPISSYNYGVDCLVELIGNREGLRRFDLCLILERSEVNAAELQTFRPKVENKYTKALCRELILWSWTLNTDSIIFEDWNYLLSSLKQLYELFSDEIPIVGTTMRVKLARLAAALACRTFSIDAEGNLLIRNCHVDYMIAYLIKIYSKPGFGYAQFSEYSFKAEKLVNEDAVKARIVNKLMYPREFVSSMLTIEELNIFYLQDLLAISPDEAREFLSFLIRNRCLKREGVIYRKTQGYTQLLKHLQSNGELVSDNRPKHLRNEFE